VPGQKWLGTFDSMPVVRILRVVTAYDENVEKRNRVIFSNFFNFKKAFLKNSPTFASVGGG
jgi:hypothetical protein